MSDILHKTLKSYHNDNPWSLDEEHPDGTLWLLTPEEWDDLPNGITVECIDGNQYTKGKDEIDDDTRFGYLAYGLRGYRD